MIRIEDFEEIVDCDFEFVPRHGERPDVVSVAWHEQSTGITRCLWRSELGNVPPYRVDSRTLFVCFVANAELGCHLSLGWPLPVHVIDLSAEFRRLVNGRIVPSGKGLLGALDYFKFDAVDAKFKEDMQKRIAKGWPYTVEERAEILAYGGSDVDALVRLLPKILPPGADLALPLHRGEYVASLARMEHFGVPIDREIFSQLVDQRAWNHVCDALVPTVDANYCVFDQASDGGWHFNMAKFEAYLERQGIAGWPRTETGKLSTSAKVFKAMCGGHPQLEGLRQLRHMRDKMRKLQLAVGADSRNRTVLWPFKSKSGRVQPKASQWIFSPSIWVRSLIKPEPGMALGHADWSSMEFMVAAALSGDPLMIEFYQNGDPYLNFAKRVGAAPPAANKQTHGALRDRYKTGLLSIQYCVRSETLASRLGTSTFEAHEMITQHHELFNVYWQWTEDWVARALDTGTMRTPLDWACATGITEFNERSIGNFAVQASAQDILRISTIWATRRGLRLVATVHDALMIEAPEERIEQDVALLCELMRRASRVVLNPGGKGNLELRTDATIIRYPDSYTDKRGTEMWSHVLHLLDQYRRSQATTSNARAV